MKNKRFLVIFIPILTALNVILIKWIFELLGNMVVSPWVMVPIWVVMTVFCVAGYIGIVDKDD